MVVQIENKTYETGFVKKAIHFYENLLNGTFEKELQEEANKND